MKKRPTLHVAKPKTALQILSVLFVFSGAQALLFSQAAPPVTPAETTSPDSEEVVELSRFTVSSAKDADSYRATDTLAGTRIRTELKDVGSAISVVTAKFLKDTGSTKSEDLLVYTTNTEVGGIGGNYAGAGNGSYLDTANARLAPQNNTRVRGLASADNTRDFFVTDIPWDSYNVGRIDLQRGPNSILFGLGSPAGIINASVNQASFKDSNAVEGRFGSYSSMRALADFNKVLLKDELALRASLLYDHTKFQQKPAFNKDERYYATLRYDPKFLRFDGIGARTSLRANYEHGNVSANRPRTTPPIDAITPWFTSMNKQGYNPLTVGVSDLTQIAALRAAGDLGAGAAQGNTIYTEPWLGSAGMVFENLVAVFSNPNSSVQGGTIFPGSPDLSKAYGVNSSGVAVIDKSIDGLGWIVHRGVRRYSDYAGQVNLPNSNLGIYKDNTLSDTSIFDFYNKLLEGPNKREWQKFEVANVALSETFLNDRIGIEFVYDWQKYGEGMTNLLSTWSQSITVDINTHLTDGSVNPNFGRPMVVSSNGSNVSRDTERENLRFTAYGELNFGDFMDKRSWLARILGRHVFTGLLSRSQYDESQRTWARSSTDDVYGSRIGVSSINTNQRLVVSSHYLGNSLANATSASGAGIGNLGAVQTVSSGVARFYDSTWTASGVLPTDLWTNPATGAASTQSENPGNYAGWINLPVRIWNSDTSDIVNLYNGGSMAREIVESQALVWQGYLMDGLIVPTVGWRKDSVRKYSIQADSTNAQDPNTKIVNFNSPLWRLSDTPNISESGESTSWSIVAHTPKWIVDKMPGRTSLSVFYNRSSNFQPGGIRVDIMGDSLTSPTGKTKDYGFAITTLNDRLTLRVNWYETKIKNAKLDGIDNDYMVGAAEAWGYMFAMQAKNRTGNFGSAEFANTGGYAKADPSMSDADAKAAAELAVNTFLGNLAPDKFMQAWHYQDQLGNWSSWIQPNAPTGLTVTGDTMSKGIEFELTAQPVRNWNISLNIAKTTATRTNMAESFVNWIEGRWEFYKGPAGDVRLWGPWYNPGDTVRGKFEREFYSGYRLYRLQEGADVPELRPWRFNIVTSYSFEKGWIKGFNVGMGYRWQDKVVLGYQVKNDDFDLDNPYYGPTEDAFDFWAGYQRQLTKKIKWSIQLNVRNLFENAHLVPVTVQPNGAWASCRIAEGMVWSITNRFEF